MKKLKNILLKDNIGCGYLYFYIHFITEIVCFYYLSTVTKNSMIVWLIPFIYDGLAFVPQSLIGYIKDKYKKINVGLIGCTLLFISILIYMISKSVFISLFFICIGNAFIHVSGAEVTLRNSNGKLSHSAIFVSGGSFGVITGKLLSNSIPIYYLLPLILTMIPFILLADTYKEETTKKFNYNNKKINPAILILLVMFIIMIRGYIGYGIPTSWNKTVYQTILLYSFMGIGKALGGILSDTFGIKKIAILSTLLAIPLLCFGDKIMIISLLGVMMFSMTMSITLALLTSVLKKTPGLAFGLTTISLFLGTIPIFFIKLNTTLNISLIIIFSLICSLIFKIIIKEEGKI